MGVRLYGVAPGRGKKRLVRNDFRSQLGKVALWVAVITAVVSGVDYYRRFNHVLTQSAAVN